MTTKTLEDFSSTFSPPFPFSFPIKPGFLSFWKIENSIRAAEEKQSLLAFVFQKPSQIVRGRVTWAGTKYLGGNCWGMRAKFPAQGKTPRPVQRERVRGEEVRGGL